MALLYKDGKTEALERDTVLGDRVKGQVVGRSKDGLKVIVSSKGPWDPSKPHEANLQRQELDPSDLTLAHRPAPLPKK